jgi:hypothetical protein
MLHRSAQVAVALFLALCPVLLSGQAAPREFYVVCTSQANLPTVYFSGTMQGPATALVQFRIAFAKFLMQSYSYQGAVDCAPSATAAISQQSLNTRVTALRRVNKSVVETGWTESAAAAAAAATPANPPAAAPPAPAPAPAAASAPAPTTTSAAASASSAKAVQGQSAGSGGGGGSANSGSQVASILGSIFGTNTGSTSAAGASGAAAAGGAAAGSASGGKAGQVGAAANAAGTASQNPTYGGITGTLTSLFGNKSANNSNAGGRGQPPAGGAAAANPGGQPAPAAATPKSAPNGLSDGALGTAQFGTTKLVVYGCGRQDMQVACVTDLTNQDTKDTLVQSADIWKDAFIVDDRGDRHQRASGFFLNIDGDQRQQLDISYGKTARFILMFSGVPTKVAKVALRSATGGLDVEEIGLIAPGAATTATTAPAGQQQ